MKSFSIFFLTLVLATWATAQESRGFKYGERPSNSVFDPAGVLSIKQQEKISEPLQKILKEENIDVLVIVLPEIGDAPPEHIARGFAQRWSEKKLNSVILHVPNNPESPWIFPGDTMGEVIKPEVLSRSVGEAEKRASAEPEDFGKIRAASIEAADLLRYWAGGAMLRMEKQSTENLKTHLKRENRNRILKLAALLFAAATIAILAGFFTIKRKGKSGGELKFPDTRKIARLGAPYCGGNHATSKGI